MDDELQHLEAELKRLRPSVPSTGLQARIALGLAARERRSVGHTLKWWQPWSIGAALSGGLAAAIVYVGTFSPKNVDAETVYVSEVYWDPQDLGILVVDDHPPVRMVNYQKLTSVQWRDSEDRTTVEWIVPAEETALVSVNSRYR